MSGSPARGFDAFLAQLRHVLEPALADWLKRTHAESVRGGPSLDALRGAVASLALQGGKRLRPALVALAYWGVAGGDLENALAATRGAQLSMELLQVYLLIHDDWMDQDEVRRGAPTVHIALGAAFGSKALGASAAVLAGDYAAALSQRALLECNVEPGCLVAAARELATMQERVVLGQGMDVLAVLGGEAHMEQAFVELIHEYKTASYTVTGPLLVGASLAGASEATRSQLLAFGRLAGIAFQLRDDLLGTYGDPAMTGKDTLTDLRQGKRTALLAELPHAGIARDVHDRVLQGAASDEELATVRAALEATGAKERIEARIQVLVGEAWNIAQTLPWATAPSELLHGALMSLTERAR